MPNRIAILVMALLFLLAPLSAAARPDAFDRPGGYISLLGVYQHNVFESKLEDLLQDAASPIAVSLSIEDSGGLGGVLGYRLASFFAVELQYEWLDEYKIEGSVAGLPTSSIYSIDAHNLTANAKLILPIWRIQPYLSVGVGFASWEVDRGPLAAGVEALDPDVSIDGGQQLEFAGRAGLGLDLYLTPNLVLNAQGQIVLTTLEEPELGDIAAFNYVGFAAGLTYRF